MFKILTMKLNKTLALLVLFLTLGITNPSFAQNKIALYSGIGVWTDGIIALSSFFQWANFDFDLVTEGDMNSTRLSSYDLLIIPGGNAGKYADYITNDGKQAILEFVQNGGSYLGICAGSYFAAQTTVWNGNILHYGLNLFDGTAIGPITDIAEWPYYEMAEIEFNNNDTIATFLTDNKQILYYGGPYFVRADSAFDTVALFANYKPDPAIIKYSYGDGRVVLMSPHPEIEENSTRDGTDFAGYLDDRESDWDVLYYSILWLKHQSQSQIQTSAEEPDRLAIFPNPVRNNLYIRTNTHINTIRIYNLHGQLIKATSHTSTIDVSGLLSGTYILEITTSNSVIRQKFIKL